MVHRAGALARQVLIQRAAEGDVQDLDAAADGQDREPASLGARDEGQLDRVARPIGLAQLGVRRRPVAAGLHILAPREDETVHPVERGARRVGVEDGRDDEGNDPGAHEGVHVSRIQGDALPPRVGAARRAHRHDPRHCAELGGAAGVPSNGHFGFETPAQSTRTPYTGIVRSCPVREPMLGYPSGGRCDS